MTTFMTDDRKLPTKQSIEQQRRSRMWYVDYPEDEEYEFEPEWAEDIEQNDWDYDNGTGASGTTFKSKTEENEWIRSTKKHNLMDMR